MSRTLETCRLILASASPRRKKLLTDAGMEFEVVSPPIQEPDDGLRYLQPSQQAEALAYFKARCVAQEHPDCLVIGADTLVALGKTVLGKAPDASAAREMLRTLSGTKHAVITGVALVGPDEQRLISSDVTWVQMRKMSDDEIEAYIASGQWVGKAGAYGIQESAERFIESIDGSFTNVVGLPMELTRRMLAEMRDHPDAHRAV